MMKEYKDLTPVPKNPNLIETVEDLYERVKEAVEEDKDLNVSVLFTCGAMINYQLAVNDGLSSSPIFGKIVEIEAAIRYGLKVEVVE